MEKLICLSPAGGKKNFTRNNSLILFPLCKKEKKKHQLVRRGTGNAACLHNLPRHLFLTIWMQSQSASLPTAPRSSTRRVVLQPAAAEHPGFKTQQSDGLSLTPSRLSVSHIHSLHLYSILYSSSLPFHLHSPPFALAPLSLWIFESSHIQSPVCHQGWISSLHLPLASLSPLPPLMQPICLFYLLADSGISILSRRWAETMSRWHRNIMWQC